MRRSRRKAREAALQALYKIELAKASIATAIDELREHSDMQPEVQAYAESLVQGVRDQQPSLDKTLAALIPDYNFRRLATVDKIVLRIAAYEILYQPAIPPKVSIDEAIEIARKYSTIESGAFVNGVLDTLLKASSKANWDPAAAPPEQEEPPPPEEPIEVVEETISADSEEAKRLARIGGWKLRSE